MSDVPSNPYEIYISDHSGKLVTALQKWDRLEYSQRVNDPWNCTLDLHLSEDDPVTSIVRNIKRDYFLEIYRTDLKYNIRDRVYEGLHHTLTEQITNSGNVYFGMFSGGYTKLLERRLVFPAPGLENNSKTGKAETLAKAYVKNSMVLPHGYSGSFYENGVYITINIDGSSRIMPGMSIAGDQARGLDTDYSARFTGLESVIKALVEDGALYYGIERGGKLGEFVFDCRPIWGKDRREGNVDGNKPAVFSVEKGNMLRPIFSENRRYEKNVILVGGSGEAENRRIVAAIDVEAVAISPWGWSELWSDARKVTGLSGLQSVGLSTLWERGVQRSLNFEVIQTEQSRWLRHWGVGDFVTTYHHNFRFDKVITEVRANVDAGTAGDESIIVEMVDLPPTGVFSSGS